jgi:hypothetical protein
MLKILFFFNTDGFDKLDDLGFLSEDHPCRVPYSDLKVRRRIIEAENHRSGES